MEWGNEHEPNAKHAYTLATGREIQNVGFVLPDGTDAYGGSPDALVKPEPLNLLETKCPAPETLISYHAEGVLPIQYKPQVQGLLFITGAEWCDFYAWHPLLTPFLVRVEPDLKYHAKMASALLQLLEEIQRIESRVSRMKHEIVSDGARKTEVRWDDE